MGKCYSDIFIYLCGRDHYIYWGGGVGQTLKEVPAQENLRKKYRTKRAMKTKLEENLLPRKVAQPLLLQNFLMKKKYISNNKNKFKEIQPMQEVVRGPKKL